MSSVLNPQSDADQLEAAADQAIEACGGNAREAVKALIVANQFLETDLEKLKAAVSKGYARGKLKRPKRCRVIGRIGMIDYEIQVTVAPWQKTAALNGLIRLGIRSRAAPRLVRDAITAMPRDFPSAFATFQAIHSKPALI